MRTILRQIPILVLALAITVPAFAAIGPDVTLPGTGHVYLPDRELSYRTELVLTNHRDVRQYVLISFITGGYDSPRTIFSIEPRQTTYHTDGGSFGSDPRNLTNQVGALRIRAIADDQPGDDLNVTPDPLGQIEAMAHVVAERGRFASKGATRQEIAGIPSAEYHAEEAVFLGVQHSLGNGVYTNVGIVNMHPTQTETFYVQFQYGDPVAVVVPPLSARQIRVPGEGSGGRYVRVYPEWSIGEGAPARTTPWVAYASTVDMQTGDAFSGIRVPATSTYNRLAD